MSKAKCAPHTEPATFIKAKGKTSFHKIAPLVRNKQIEAKLRELLDQYYGEEEYALFDSQTEWMVDSLAIDAPKSVIRDQDVLVAV
ncbi:MAG: hypothetical protein EOO20_24280, partial [Chryseobacterium sp.]